MTVQACIVSDFCQEDLDGDGVIGVNDLMQLLSLFGTDCEAEDVDPELGEFTCGDPMNYHGYDYATVLIGEQCWFAENLRVQTFMNGDIIEDLSASEEWSETQIAAYSTNFSIPADFYYNWHAVLDNRQLCPESWHLPFQGEAEFLIETLGGNEVAGMHLKADSGWLGDGNGTNSSGFSGLPSGEKLSSGGFDAVGSRGYWWLQPFLTENTSSMRLKSDNDYVVFHNNIFSMNTGRSIRCLKDSEE